MRVCIKKLLVLFHLPLFIIKSNVMHSIIDVSLWSFNCEKKIVLKFTTAFKGVLAIQKQNCHTAAVQTPNLESLNLSIDFISRRASSLCRRRGPVVAVAALRRSLSAWRRKSLRVARTLPSVSQECAV